MSASPPAVALCSHVGASRAGKPFVCAAFIALLSLSATAAVAATDQDPIATAPAPLVVSSQSSAQAKAQPAVSQAPLDTNAQIEAFIRSAPSTPWRNDAPLAGQDLELKRQVHGQVGVAVGTGGYRSAFVQADIPVGETGMLSVAVSESRSNHAYAYGGYPGYGYGGPGSYGAFGYGDSFGHGARRSLGVSLYLGDSVRSGDCRGRFTPVKPPSIGSGWSDDRRCATPGSSRFGRSRPEGAY